jgi:hypothetical protein
MTKNVLTDNLSEPLNGATTAKVDIHAGDGNLTIDRLTGGEQVLVSGACYLMPQEHSSASATLFILVLSRRNSTPGAYVLGSLVHPLLFVHFLQQQTGQVVNRRRFHQAHWRKLFIRF